MPALTLGWEVVKWASKYLKHPNGPRAGQRWQFVDSQVRFLLWWYSVDADGHWLFHHGVRRLAKGSGKSPFAALLALAELTAPVRLLDFDPRAAGGCVGKSVDMPLVQIAATAESQTANTMRMVRAMAPKGSRLVADFQLDPGKTQYYMLPEGKLEVITSSATAAEGAEATFIVGDETEHWKPNNGGPELASTLEDNLAKSGSRMLETSNAWVPEEGSVAEASWDAWVAQEEGRVRAESRILYDARVAPPETDMADPESLAAALEHVYDDCWWADRRAIMNRIWDPRSAPEDSRRKYLNQPTAAADAWLAAHEWPACADASVVVADGDEVVMFFDGSKSRDATALIGCRVSDGHVFEIDTWEQPLVDPTQDGEPVAWQVPVNEVDAAVARAFRTWRVVAFFGDVKEWESYVHTTWPDLYREQLVLWAQDSGRNASPIAWDMRSHVRDFTMAAEACHTEIVERQFTHDGAAVTSRHVANARRRPNRYGVSIGKESRTSPKKIDAAVCVIGARMVRRQLLVSSQWAKYKAGPKKRAGRVVGWG
ncbi:terminase [Streptomyces sp. HNM0663]|uniref:Terminase n=1 Tax=Streptomyces chengmaiensis TaxID=3040919 RepID=A0ABT6HVM3_9ACTN|nr:terminase [Streptomyces chengmaiensis]